MSCCGKPAQIRIPVIMQPHPDQHLSPRVADQYAYTRNRAEQFLKALLIAEGKHK